MNNNDEFEIDLLKLLRVWWSKALAILLAGVIAAAAAFAYTIFFITPTYSASTSVYVNNSSISLGSTSLAISATQISTSNALVDTYIFILKSRTTLEDVIARAGLRYNYSTLSHMVSTQVVEGTSAFNIIVSSKSPTEAELIANTIAEVLPERISEIIDGSSPRIVDYAIVPSHRASPNYLKNTAVGFLIGVVAVLGFITVRFLIDEQNDMIIHSADQLRSLYPDVKILAMIPDMRLSEKRGYYYSSYYGDKKKRKEAR